MTTGKKRASGRNAENSAKSSAVKRRGNPDKIRAHQFKPGQSGNPGGRPRKIITEGYESILREVIVRNKKRDTRLRHMLRAIVDEAIQGKIPAIAEITDRVEGKAVQAVQMSGPGGGPMQIEAMTREQREKRLAELLAKANVKKGDE